MKRSNVFIPIALAVAVAVLIGVAGYYAVAQALSNGEDAARKPAVPDRQAELLERVAALEKQVAELKARPKLVDELGDEKVRDQLAGVMVEARKRDREAQERKQAAERAERFVSWYRRSYKRLLDDAREKTGVEEAKWKGLEPVLDKHFAPVAQAIKVKAAEGGRYVYMGRGEISSAVAEVLPATLAALQKELSPKAWKAFDAWRRQVSTDRWGRNPRAEYFLKAGEFRKVQAKAATDRRWGSLKRALPDLVAELKLDAARQKQFEALMRGHVELFTAAFGGRPFVNVNDDENRARIKKLAAATDAKVKKLLGEEALAKYTKWKKDPANRVGLYFGEEVARRRGGGRDRGNRDRRPQAPQTQPAPPAPKRAETF